MKAKKFIETKTEGEYELKKFHVVDVDVTQKDIDDVWKYIDCDDPEEAYESYGVAIGFDDDIAWLDIKKFVQGIDNYFEEDDDDLPDWIGDVIAKLRKFDEYTLG